MTGSTRSPDLIEDPAVLLRRAVSLAVLDAIVHAEADGSWDPRRYTFETLGPDGPWAASLFDPCGNHLVIVFDEAGTLIKGADHEASMAPARHGGLWPGLFDGMPPALARFREVGFPSDITTFCLWWDAGDPGWRHGIRAFPEERDDPDGSGWLLAEYDGDAETYAEDARDCREVEASASAVQAIFDHAPLTAELVRRVNPAADPEAVLAEIASLPYGDAP